MLLPTTTTPRVGLFGAPLDTGNLGVSALGVSTLAALQRHFPASGVGAGSPRPVVFDNGRGVRVRPVTVGDDELTCAFLGASVSRRVHRPESLTNMRAFARIWPGGNRNLRAIDACDLVLDVSAGDSFTDLYGPKRFRLITQTKELVLDRGRPLVLLPQTYGPFRDPANRAVAHAVTAAASQAWARDGDSYDRLRELLGADFDPDRHRQGVDLAFALPSRDPAASVPRLADWLGDAGRHDAGDHPPVVAINVSGLLANDPERARAEFGLASDHAVAMRALVERFLTTTDVRVLLVPHVRGTDDPAASDTESDDVACRRLLDEFGRSPRLQVVPGGLGPSELKGIIARAAWATGARMHATIAALSSGVPVTGIAYSPKMRGVFATCGVGEDVIDARRTGTGDLVDALWAGFERREQTAAALATAVPTVVTRARDQFDEMLDVGLPSDRPDHP